MKIPERACRLKLDLQADTRDEMVRALEGIATSIDRSEMSTGCSGGVHSGWTYEYIQNTGPTHEQYQAQLKAYIAAKRAEKETTSALPPHLRDDAPYKQCSVCQRKSWEDPEHEAICWMPQPGGDKCHGVLRLVQNR